MFEIIPAERESAPITASFIGGSGSGKTLSALLFARGLVGPEGKIVMIDTEGGRSKIYAKDQRLIGSDGYAFHHLDLIEPYTSERFRTAFKDAVAAGANAVIIDTASHEHEGFLELADQEAARMNNSKMSNRNKWIKPKAGRKRFYSAISSSHCHVIATIRLNRIVNMDVKPAIEIMKPECDKDFPYRMDLSVEIQPDHTTKIIKVPEPLIGMVEGGVMITMEHGKALAADISSQKKPAMEKILNIITNLEEAADSGPDTLRNAWEAAWRNSGNEGDTKTITPDRAELRKHLDRLKALAAAAENIKVDDEEPGSFGDVQKNADQEIDDKELFNSNGG